MGLFCLFEPVIFSGKCYNNYMNERVSDQSNLRPHRKYAINLLGRFVGAGLRKNKNAPSFSIRMTDTIIRHTLPKPETNLTKEQFHFIDDLYQKAKLWHGTGRYQYKNSKPVDILRYIAAHGALHPQLDSWDFAGPMTTISLAPSRVYARAYADMHGKGAAEPGRYGSSLFWAALFVGDMKFEGLIEGKAWTPKGLQATRKHIAKNSDIWYRKISSTKLSTMEAFYYGSDIPDNYPIIFGVKSDSIQQAPTTRTVAIHEVRSDHPLPLDKEVTHIEVPRERIRETETILTGAGHDMPVIAIEDVETYTSHKLFSELVANYWDKQDVLKIDPKKVRRSLVRDD